MADRAPDTNRRRQTVLLAVLAIVIVVYAALYVRRGGIVSNPGDVEALEYTARNLPLLALGGPDSGAGDVAESGGNPFAFRPPPTPTPRIAYGTDGRPKPPPPPFNREYIGHLGPKPFPVAAFRKAGAETAEVEVAAVGEVLDDIFIVRAIGLESVTIGFVGYDVSEDTSVPLSDK